MLSSGYLSNNDQMRFTMLFQPTVPGKVQPIVILGSTSVNKLSPSLMFGGKRHRD